MRAITSGARPAGTGNREFLKKVRDHVLRRTPGLQSLVRSGARRGHIPPSLWRRLHPWGVWTLHAPDGTPFRYDSTHAHDGLARHIVWTDMRHWETSTQPVLYELAKRAEVFVDVGAYSGVYTLLACIANPGLRAVAVEPNPGKLGQVRANVALNGLQDRVTVIGKALSSRPGTSNLVIPTDDSQASLAEVATQEGPVVEVPVTTGDEILGDLPVDLIKIDVEGHEPAVLEGMATVLASRRPKIIAECLHQGALEAVRRQAADHGYRYVYHIDETGPVPVDDGFVHPFRSPNYLFSATPATFDDDPRPHPEVPSDHLM